VRFLCLNRLQGLLPTKSEQGFYNNLVSHRLPHLIICGRGHNILEGVVLIRVLQQRDSLQSRKEKMLRAGMLEHGFLLTKGFVSPYLKRLQMFFFVINSQSEHFKCIFARIICEALITKRVNKGCLSSQND